MQRWDGYIKVDRKDKGKQERILYEKKELFQGI